MHFGVLNVQRDIDIALFSTRIVYHVTTIPAIILDRDKIRTWTEDWLAEYDTDPETVAERIRTASLTGLSGYVPMTDEEMQAAGIG